MTKYILLLLFTFVCNNNFGQTIDTNKALDVKLLQKDFRMFRDSLEIIHPALYRYQSKRAIDRLFDSCYATINEGMAEIQFYMILRFLTSSIEDGHTAATLEKEFMNEQMENANVFPLKLSFIGTKAYLLCNYNNDIAAGTEIISIDKKTVNELRTTLFRYLVSDGRIETKKYLDFDDGAFPILYNWLYGEKKQFAVNYKTTSGNSGSIIVHPTTFESINCSVKTNYSNKYLNLEFKNKHLAILTIKSFDINRLNDDENYFGRFIDSAFVEINNKRISKLIVDIRDNAGGEDSYGAILFSYLTNKPFKYYSSIKTISYSYPKSAHPNLEIQNANKNNFKGECFFLINGRSFSTTSEFCAIARSNDRGKFIGTETGGGYYGNTGGEHSRFTLPGTRIVIIIPKRRYDLAVKSAKLKDRGTIADYYIQPTIEDIINNRDVQLEYAIEMTEKNTSR